MRETFTCILRKCDQAGGSFKSLRHGRGRVESEFTCHFLGILGWLGSSDWLVEGVLEGLHPAVPKKRRRAFHLNLEPEDCEAELGGNQKTQNDSYVSDILRKLV